MRRKQVKEETYEPRGGPRTIKRELQAFIPSFNEMFPSQCEILPKKSRIKRGFKGKQGRVGRVC
jgi:hypothetical protein